MAKRKTYRCPRCDKRSFSSLSALNMHIRAAHSKDIKEKTGTIRSLWRRNAWLIGTLLGCVLVAGLIYLRKGYFG